MFSVDCVGCDSENVKLIEETNCEGTPNKHYRCLDCGDYFTQVSFLLPPMPAKEEEKKNESR